MQHRNTKNMQPTPSVSRAKPLALALALAFAGGADLAGAATAGHAATAAGSAETRAASGPGTATPRPDGSILWLVENCDDAGSGSLRDAAAHANHGDGIDLTGLSCSTISLTSGAITLHDVDLTGPGADQLEIDGTGNQNHRIFNHSGAGGTLGISGVTVNAGKYLSNAGLGGGCLRSTGGNLRIHDSKFTNCLVVTPLGADGNARGGAIAIYGDGTIELTNATISGSWAKTDHEQALGGGLYAQGYVDMQGSTISNNTASGTGGAYGFGGGLFTRGGVWIESSTIDGNLAARGGGGAMVQQGGVLLRSTVSNNAASLGASGIAFLGFDNAVTSVISSTISGNSTAPSAQGLSGGLYANTAVTSISNSTITANAETNAVSTKFGAGIVFGPNATDVRLSSTIASGNYFDDDAPPYAADDIDGPASLTILGDTNLVGWTHRPVPADTLFESNPRLGPLQDNGGPTLTHLPLAGSPVIDQGDAHALDIDQRGYARVVGSAADVGAVEAGADTIFADGFE